MANVFMCSIEERLDEESKLPPLYKRYVDDTLALLRVPPAATAFLTTLNDAHPSIHFTMETAINNRLPFIDVRSRSRPISKRPTNKPSEDHLFAY